MDQRRCMAGGQRNAVLRKDVAQQRRGARPGAVDEHDLARGNSGLPELEHLLGDELGLSALPAGLQQGHRIAGVHARRRGVCSTENSERSMWCSTARESGA